MKTFNIFNNTEIVKLQGFMNHRELGLARLIEISVNWLIYNRKTIIDMKMKKIGYFNWMFCSFIQLKFKRNCLL